MSGHVLEFKKLILEGFGLYRERTEFDFTNGVNCYVAENESGKTTMIAGLVATYFGLSHRQRAATSFTLERYRNWDNPARCTGEVYFSAGNDMYLINRNFDTHQVELWKVEDDFTPKNLLIEGTHNPEAQKPLQAYEDKLRELLGMKSQELFLDTFCVEQPLPEHTTISDELQGLLAGGRGTSFQGALKHLAENLRALTKYTGPNNRGVTPKNSSKEGELERLSKEISEFEQSIEKGRETADSLEEIQKQLKEAEKNYEEKTKELNEKKKTRQAWEAWQRLQQEYNSAARERDRLQEAEKEADRLQKKITELEESLEKEYPEFIEFKESSAETGEKLDELVHINESMLEKDDNIERLRNSIMEKWNRLSELYIQENEKFPGWEWLGADPVDRVKNIRKNCEACRKEWRQYRQYKEELEQIKSELQNEFAAFEQATQEQIDLVKHYHRYLAEKQEVFNKASEKLNNVKAQLDNHEKSRQSLEERYGELRKLPPNAAEAVNGKLDSLKKEKDLRAEEESIKRKITPPAGMRLAGMAVMAVLASILTGALDPILLAVSLAVAVIIGYFGAGVIYSLISGGSRQKLWQIQESLRQLQNDILSFDSMLGSYASAGEAELGRLAQQLQQYAEENSRLEEEAQKLPSEETLFQLQDELQKAEEALQDFKSKTSLFSSHFEDAAEGWRQWQAKKDRKKTLETWIGELARESFGGDTLELNGADPLSEKAAYHWQGAARFMQLLSSNNTPPADISSLAGQLEELSEEWWQKQEEKAAELARVKKEVNELIPKINSENDHLNGEMERRKELHAKFEEIATGMQKVLQAHRHDPESAHQKWKQMEGVLAELKNTKTKLETILQNQGVEEISSLQSKLSQKIDDVNARMLRWKEHIDLYPGLPATDQVDDLEKIGSYLEKLEAEMSQLEEEQKALEKGRNDLTRQQAALEGEAPLNIAAAEEELSELKERKKQLELEADALEVAYKELDAAVNEYRSSYKEHLEDQASSYCQKISGLSNRLVEMDDDFQIYVREAGRKCSLDILSKGARDQLYLALRFAVADLLADEVKLPLIFDDPFISTDGRRRNNIYHILQNQATERQFILLSHADIFSTWGNPITVN